MSYTQVTLATLRIHLADRWDAVPFWTTVDADLAINDALRQWSATTGFWRCAGTAIQPANDPFVALLLPMTVGTRVVYNGFPLEPTSLQWLDAGRPGWQADRGVPVVWAPVDLQTIVLYPASPTTITVTVEAVQETPVLVTPVDFVQLGAEEESAILDYAVHAAALKMGATFLQQTTPHLERYRVAAVLRNRQLLQVLAFRDAWNRHQARLRVPDAEEEPA